MINVEQVPAQTLVERLSKYLKEQVKELRPPEWALFSKTTSFKERVPDNPEEWWYVRAASILRRIYIDSLLSVGDTKVIYGGRKRRGSRPPEFRRAPGHSTRIIMQQLERAGLVAKTKGGRRLTSRGRSVLDKLSMEIFKELADRDPSLKKYLE
jgi:small subunit ribosomal protein S19e